MTGAGRRSGRTGRQAEWLRGLYAGGHGNATARRYARFWAAVFGRGLVPGRWVTLEVRGRSTGQLRRFPLGMADLDGNWYLVSMLGECSWVRNVRAASGHARLLGRRPGPVLLTEVPAHERPRILRRYLDTVPGARPHVAVDRGAPLESFAAVADRHPVFRVTWTDADTGQG